MARLSVSFQISSFVNIANLVYDALRDPLLGLKTSTLPYTTCGMETSSFCSTTHGCTQSCGMFSPLRDTLLGMILATSTLSSGPRRGNVDNLLSTFEALMPITSSATSTSLWCPCPNGLTGTPFQNLVCRASRNHPTPADMSHSLEPNERGIFCSRRVIRLGVWARGEIWSL